MSWPARLGDRIAAGFRQSWIDPQAVRAEAWALGGRHQGRVVEGARRELREPGLSARRAGLLKAVVRSENAKGAGAR